LIKKTHITITYRAPKSFALLSIKLMRQTVNKKEKLDRLIYERELWKEGSMRVMGLDEVGRGCLAGPVVAAGVILKPDTDHDGLRDSKTMSARERNEMTSWIKSNATYWWIAEKSPAEIDQINILKASIQAMMECAEQIGAMPDHLLVDGNRYGSSLIPYTCLVKGDNRSASIAAASILAKTYRDHLMRSLHEEHPQYKWDQNVGYPTKAHYESLQKYGATIHHRRSFSLRTDKVYHPA
jgi:ribonuclease HII